MAAPTLVIFDMDEVLCRYDFAARMAHMAASTGESLFIDDTADYIAGAAEAGLATHHFQSADALRADFEDRGLL